MATASVFYGFLEEVAELEAAIDANPRLLFAHLAANHISSCRRTLETRLVDEDENTDAPMSLRLLRKIATTYECTSIITAIANDDTDLVVLMIESGIDVSSKSDYDELSYALQFGRTDVVRLLLELPLERGVNPAKCSDWFQYVCKNGYTDIVRLLLDSSEMDLRANMYLGLHAACETGHTDIVRLLLDAPPERGGVDLSASMGYALQTACAHGRTDVVRLLLDAPPERGVDPSTCGNAPLRMAFNNRHLDIFRLLLDLPLVRGVDPGQCDIFRQICSEGQIDAARLLLEHPLRRMNLTACLRIACETDNSIDIVRLLLQKGAKPDNNHALRTAIAHAAKKLFSYFSINR